MRFLLVLITLASPATADQHTDEICALFTQITGPAFDYQTDMSNALNGVIDEVVTLRKSLGSDAVKMQPLIDEFGKVGEIVMHNLSTKLQTQQKLRRVTKLCAFN